MKTPTSINCRRFCCNWRRSTYRSSRRRVTPAEGQRRNSRTMKLYAVALLALSACASAPVPVSAGVYGDDRGARPDVLDECDALYDKGDREGGRACYTGLLESSDL